MKSLILCLMLWSSGSFAATKDGVEFKDSIEQAGTKLVLNGMGYRIATIFRVKVYLAGLYLKEKSSDAEKIIASTDPKIVRMIFKRDVEKEKFKEGILISFEKNKLKADDYKSELDKMFGNMTDIKEGDEVIVSFTSKEIDFSHAGKKINISGEAFSRDLLKLWLNTPPNEELKAGMLGLDK